VIEALSYTTVGVEWIGFAPDPSRSVADGLARFEASMVLVDARCRDSFDEERVNFNATVVDADRPSSTSHQTAIHGQPFCVVAPESGPFAHGVATVLGKGIVSGDGITNADSRCIVRDREAEG
jgi:hypothetical protein